MSLLTEASLIVTPNGYNVGKLYSVVPNTTLGDMDVVRALSATRVNSAGLIEIARTNLALRSEEFDNLGVWPPSIGGTGVNPIRTANSTISPIGTLTADTILFDRGAGNTSTDQSVINQLITITAAETYVFSCYLKATTISDVGKQVFIRCGGAGGLIAVTLLSTWVRFQTSATISAVTNQFQIGSRGTFTSSNTVSADIWGAQVEIGNVATEYIPTTTVIRTKFAGITQDGLYGANIPRLDYTNSTCPSILVEPTRTNEATQSDGNLSTYPTNLNVTDAASSFNSFVNAIQFPSTGESRANKSIVTTAQTYTISVFIKMDDNSVPILGSTSITGNLCLLIASNIATSNLKVESYGNNVYRLSATATSTGVGLANGVYRFAGQVLKSFKTTGIQLEAGSNATSYIPTTTATVTRTADVISKTGISSLIGQTEGTLYFEVQGFSDGNTTFQFITLNDNTITNNNQIGFNYNTSGVISGYFRVNSSTLSISSTVSKTLNSKIILKYNSSNVYTLFINGSLIGSLTAASSFSSPLTTFKASQGDGGSNYNGNIKMISIWKTALDNDQCILLTGASFSTYPEMANALIYTIQ
jgi:hypothetical protein